MAKNSGLSKPGVTHNREDRPASDFYPTPEHITEALLTRERFEGVVWEPACGEGDMARVIEKHGYTVRSTDLFDHGYGAAGIDFTKQASIDPQIRSVITNPPFKLAEQFIQTCKRLGVPKYAMFQRLAFLEGKGRYNRIFADNPPARIWVFSGRVTLAPKDGGKDRKTGGFMAFAWYVWDGYGSNRSTTEIGWIEP